MGYIFFKNRYYTKQEFLDEQNELEWILEHIQIKQMNKNWKPEPGELDEMIALARELASINLSDKSEEIREEILYNLADIFDMYGLQGKGLVNLDKLRAVADQLEEPLQEYLEAIL